MWDQGKPGDAPGPGLGTQKHLGRGGGEVGTGQGLGRGASWELRVPSCPHHNFINPGEEGQDQVDGMGGVWPPQVAF